MENKQNNFVLIAMVVLIVFASFGFFSWLKYQKAAEQLEQMKQQQTVESQNVESNQQKDSKPEHQIGGQTDEHGCLLGAGYSWCSSTEKCQRMWEEYCEEYREQFKGDAGIFGDPGENPPAESDSWAEFEDAQNGFRFKYQNHYKTVQDNYGWPHAVVHLINKSGGQSYDVTFEIWESESDAQNEGRMEDTVPFFRMMEDPDSGEFVSMTCWNTDVVEDCEEIYLTLTMQ